MNSLEEINTQLELLKPTLPRAVRSGNHKLLRFLHTRRTNQKKRHRHPRNLLKRRPNKVFKFLELEEFLTQKLGVKVDLVTKNALKPFIKDRVLRETVYV